MLYTLICLLLLQVQAQTEQHLMLIHDDTIELKQPKESIEILVQLIAENLKSQCRILISIDFVSVTSENDFNEDLAGQGTNRTDAFIIVTQCEIVTPLIHRLRTLKYSSSIIFLDFFICQPLQELKAFHLEAFRFKSEIRPACVQFAIHRWMEDAVFSSRLNQKTKNLFNLTFSASDIFDECNPYQDSYASREIWGPLNLKAEQNYARHFLNDKQLRITTLPDPPYVYVDQSPSDSSTATYHGIPFNIFQLLQQCFNFRYTVSLPKSGTYGVPIANGSWNGMMGMIATKAVDVAVHSIYLDYNRVQMADFIHCTEDPNVILIPAAIPVDNFYACVKPFGSELWGLLLIVLITLPFIIWMFAKKFDKVHYRSKISLSKIYLFVFRMLMLQSLGAKIPKSRVFLVVSLLTWSFIAIIVNNVYQGKLMSSLLIKKFKPGISSIEELATSSTLRPLIYKGASIEVGIKTAQKENKVFWKIKEKIDQNSELVTNSESKIREFVAGGKYAAIYCLSYFKMIMENDYLETNECRLSLAKVSFWNPASAGFYVRKSSPLREIFTKKVLQMKQGGLDRFWRQKVSQNSAENACKKSKSKEGQVKLSLDHLSCAFFILAVGSTLATLVFIGEVVNHQAKTRCIP